jgi:hypothetical protein
MFSIRMDRILSVELVRIRYGFPKELFARIQPSLPILCIGDDGQPCYLESVVDDFLKQLARRIGASTPKPGRPDTTSGIAEFVEQLRANGKSWKEIHSACKRNWPADPRVTSLQQVRDQWRRHFGDRRRKSG